MHSLARRNNNTIEITAAPPTAAIVSDQTRFRQIFSNLLCTGERYIPGTDRSADSDNDGIADLRERALGTNPCWVDTDGDGVADGRELQVGTDSLNRDSDGDGLSDGDELAQWAFDAPALDLGARWTIALSRPYLNARNGQILPAPQAAQHAELWPQPRRH